MAQPSPLAPLKEIEAVRVTAEDVEENPEVFEIFQDFEDAWVEFLTTRPQMVSGVTADRIHRLQDAARAASESKANIEKELKEQLNGIKKSRKDLERQYSPLIDAERAKQERLKQSMNEKIRIIQDSMETFEETAPFLNFLRELDRMGGANDDVHMSSAGTIPRVAKPSVRAMILAETTSLEDPQQLVKACKIDNELYRAQLVTLQKEIERYEALSPMMEEAGVFLTEHNVWKIMKEEEERRADSRSHVA